MRRLHWIALGVIACSQALAGDGVLEINQDCVATGCVPGDSGGFPITLAPGAYRLTSNIQVDVAINGINFSGGGPVDLDLGGFTLSGGGSCTGNPVTACTAGTGLAGILGSGVLLRLRNGTVRGFDNGNLTLSSLADGSSIEDVLVTEATNTGFGAVSLSTTATGRAIRVRNLTVSRNRAIGILMPSGTPQVVFDGLIVSGNGSTGLAISAGSAVVRDSTFIRNGGVAINGLASIPVAIGNSAFLSNNGGSTAAQFSISLLLNMGGIVCEDGSCP